MYKIAKSNHICGRNSDTVITQNCADKVSKVWPAVSKVMPILPEDVVIGNYTTSHAVSKP